MMLKVFKMNVIDLIVKNDYCIGCGVCAGVCSSNNLYMDWSDKGELIPKSKNSCKDKCSICLDICPFNNHSINQDDVANSLYGKVPQINYDKYIGYYLDCYVGFHKDESIRLNSASGGLANLFLSTLLEENIVDKVIGVGNFGNKGKLFDFEILRNSEELYSCSGSAYYPVEISSVLKKILREKEDLTYAIIALPCFVYALRLAIKKVPKLKRKIKIIASLTCGQLQNRFCTELLALESGIKVDELSKMDFRRKSKDNLASNFSQVAIDKKGNEGVPQPYNELPFFLWYYHFFKQNACNYCDDIFGELADVTFMDAWLPKYVKDYRGTSLVIVRTELIKNIILKHMGNKCKLKKINKNNVIQSQMSPITKKRELIAGNLFKAKKMGENPPKKRIIPDKDIYMSNKKHIDLTFRVQKKSKELWPKHRNDQSTEHFWVEIEDMKSEILKLERLNKIKSKLHLILKIIKVR